MSDTQTNPVPSVRRMDATSISAATEVPSNVTARGVAVTSDGDVPGTLGLTREGLTRAGCDGSVGSTLVIPGDIVVVAVGIGAAGTLDAAALRNAGAAFARAAGSHSHLAVDLDGTHAVPVDVAAHNPQNVGGSCHGGEFLLDGEVVAGWQRYDTDIPGLYLTGSTTHPGGSVSGRPGRNAASAVLTSLGLDPLAVMGPT